MELTLIEKIRQMAQALAPKGGKGPIAMAIGDDCSEIVPDPGHSILLTTDTMVEDVHFRLSYFTPYILGRKLASVNLSDIAAMGGSPLGALLNLEVPPGLSDPANPFWPQFIKGLSEQLARYNAFLIGGDTVKTTCNRLALTLSLLGQVKQGRAIYRHGAKPGDLIYCSGPLGESACGQKVLDSKRFFLPLPVKRRLVKRHLDPEPRLALGQALANVGVSAMIDISDGIATDLGHIAKSSGVRANILASALPIPRSVRIFAQRLRHHRPLDFVLFGGEDYELVWTVPARNEKKMQKALLPILKRPAIRIGYMTEGEGVWLLEAGSKREITFMGYEH
ncbi:MAG: thiamine-phosphate kinase [Thermodesulfobacteria bacterium]|nr:thiamine-phosphate kinase [Thermodesulfobacteriota bacterium]